MNRAVARRLTALVPATLLVAGAVTLVAQPAQAAPVVSVVSSSFFVDSAGTENIVGEIRNDGSGNVETVAAIISLRDAANHVLGDETVSALADRLAPGEKAPFRLTFSAPAGYDHYTVTAAAGDATAPPNHSFTTTVTSEPTDAFGLKHLVGSVRNNNGTEAAFVEVVVTFYNAAGQVVNDASESVNDDTIAPGGTSAFDVMFESTPAYSSYKLFAQSNSDATPGASPSPTPSASASPSDSPSPTPTSSPAPDVTPTVTLGSSIISAGQHVTVTYHGAPNTTLRILSKTQPATSYSQITAVALDASGVGSTSHAPTKNTRIMAQTLGGTSSTQPLIQVRSVASINAKRVGVRTFTFTGRVYPALNGRLVSLYRNGALAAQARTDASGIYTMTKTLAAGTSSFQVRTANDTYNLGTSSPARSYTIS